MARRRIPLEPKMPPNRTTREGSKVRFFALLFVAIIMGIAVGNCLTP